MDCTLVLGYSGDNKDDDYPSGRPDIVLKEDNNPESLARRGQCARYTKWLDPT